MTPLLDAVEAVLTDVQYFTLRLSLAALQRIMCQQLPPYRHVRCAALWST